MLLGLRSFTYYETLELCYAPGTNNYQFLHGESITVVRFNLIQLSLNPERPLRTCYWQNRSKV